jgi:hypothetical protein
MRVRSICVPFRCPDAARFLLLPVLLAAAYAQEIRFEGGRFLVDGWKAPAVPPSGGWESVLRVRTETAAADAPSLLGTYSVEQGRLYFRPRFPISPGVRVLAVLSRPGAPRIELSFETPPAPPHAAARVVGVYPSAPLLPENLLKFYIEFSAPMSRGEAWRHLRLLDAAGKPVDLPFLEIDEELWDAEGRRLTVLFDPGRIKRGVLPLVETGPALAEQNQYTLVVDSKWRDAAGSPLAAEVRKTFGVAAADRAPIDPADWKLSVPAAASRDPLVVRFPEPLDYALLHRMLSVDSVQGVISLGAEEREWRFVPDQPWRKGDHALTIDASLEDLAGNRVGRAFDVDVFERVTSRITQRRVSLPFRIGSHQR